MLENSSSPERVQNKESSALPQEPSTRRRSARRGQDDQQSLEALDPPSPGRGENLSTLKLFQTNYKKLGILKKHEENELTKNAWAALRAVDVLVLSSPEPWHYLRTIRDQMAETLSGGSDAASSFKRYITFPNDSKVSKKEKREAAKKNFAAFSQFVENELAFRRKIAQALKALELPSCSRDSKIEPHFHEALAQITALGEVFADLPITRIARDTAIFLGYQALREADPFFPFQQADVKRERAEMEIEKQNFSFSKPLAAQLSPFCREIAHAAKAAYHQSEQQLSERNSGIVVKVSFEYRGMGLPQEDIVGEGVPGLFKALETFDPRHGVKFSTYAVWWVRQSITEALSRKSRLIHVPARLVDTIRRVDALCKEQHLDVRKAKDREHIIATLQSDGMPKVQAQKALEQYMIFDPVSLEEPLDAEETFSVKETLADKTSVDPVQKIQDDTLKEIIFSAVKAFPERERIICERRVFVEDGDSLEELGKRLGLSRERVRQIEKEAKQKLQAIVRGLYRGRIPAL